MCSPSGKYALFRDELELYLKLSHSIPMCYATGPQPLPRWSALDALPSVTEALALVVLAGFVGVLVPRKWRVTLPWANKAAVHQVTADPADETRHQLRERLLDEGRFPDNVAQQLED